MQEDSIRRGDVFYADLSPVIGCEQRGVRPVLIIQNDVGNQHSPTTIVVAITGKNDRSNLPTHVPIPQQEASLNKNSVVLVEQIRTIDKQRLRKKICSLNDDVLKKVDEAIKISLALTPIVSHSNLK